MAAVAGRIVASGARTLRVFTRERGLGAPQERGSYVFCEESWPPECGSYVFFLRGIVASGAPILGKITRKMHQPSGGWPLSYVK